MHGFRGNRFTTVTLLVKQVTNQSHRRSPGYVEALKKHGIWHGDFIEISEETYAWILVTFQPERFRGLGDVISEITHRLKLPQCSRCIRWQDWLNRRFPINPKNSL